MKAIKTVALGLAGTAGAGLLWSLAIEPYLLDVTRYAVALPHLPPAWQGQKVALIADVQVGMWLANTATVRHAIGHILGERPALVLLAGDFVYAGSRDVAAAIDEMIGLLRPLPQAGLSTYAVLGNHDYRGEEHDRSLAHRVQQALEAVAIAVLQNEAVALAGPEQGSGEPLYLMGIGAHEPAADSPRLALAEVPERAARLVVMHNPNSFFSFPAYSAPLAVAGHTHGGQIRLPFWPLWRWYKAVTDREEIVYQSGWLDDFQPGNCLYVNRGIGFSHLPLRFNAPPELTYFVLQSPSPGEGDSSSQS